jgi:phytoene synthase
MIGVSREAVRPADLPAAYARCRTLTKAHGTTYYWSTKLLPRDRQPHVCALYAFCRVADDIVDDLSDEPVEVRATALRQLGDELRSTLRSGRSTDPVLAAVTDTIHRFDLDPSCFERFLRSMTMDLTISGYETYGDLMGYMDGSAAVIGEMMLPILEPLDDEAFEPARDLGVAFQLTNFIRDVGEDLDRGRVYLPQEDVRRFGADPWARAVTPAWRELLQFEIDRARSLYRRAEDGIDLLPPSSARCIASAHRLYRGILDQVERADYDVFSMRARVPLRRKLSTVATAWLATGVSSRGPRQRAGTTGTRNP